jgi:hypothetical protein
MWLAPFCSIGSIATVADGALLDPLFKRFRMDDPVDEDAWRVNVIGIDGAGFD